MPVRGVRGATTVEADESGQILTATTELLHAMLTANPLLESEDIASVIFTVTEDLNSAFPAQAARQIGWDQVPLICMQEIPVRGSLALCIRVLIHWNADLPPSSVRHVYLHAAIKLRPDQVQVGHH